MFVKNSLLRFPLLICLIFSPYAAGETPTSQINNISLPIKSKPEDFSSTHSGSSAQLVRFKLNGSQSPMKMVQIEPEEIVLEGIGEWQETGGGIDCDAEMSPPPLNDFSQIIYSILMPIVCLLGSIGALICVFIFTRRQMRSSLSMYLAGLSAFDFVLLLCATIIYPSMNLCLQEGNRGPICHFFWRTSLATYPLSLMAQTASVWTVVAITVDRYLAVRYPLHMRAWCTPHRARTVVFFITVVAVLFKMPSFFEVSLNECGHLMKTTLRDHYLYFTIYYTYGYLLLMLAAPFLFIIVLNARILSIIRTANIQRRQMNVVRRNSRVTRTSRSSSGFTTATALKRGSSGSWVHQHQNNLHNGGGSFHPHAAATMSSGGGIIGPHTNNCHMPLYSAIPPAIGNNNHPHHALHQHQHGHGSIAGIVGGGNFTNSNGSNSNGNAGNGGGNGSNATAECVTMTIDNRCTKMAVMTIAAFIAFNLLAGLNHVIEAFQWVEDDGTNLRIPIGNFLVCLNSATNILIYSIFGRRFRKMFVLQFCPCWRQKYSELNRSTCQNKTEIL